MLLGSSPLANALTVIIGVLLAVIIIAMVVHAERPLKSRPQTREQDVPAAGPTTHTAAPQLPDRKVA